MMKYVSETACRRPNLLMSPLTCKDVKVGDANALVGFGAGTVKAEYMQTCADPLVCMCFAFHLTDTLNLEREMQHLQ